MRVLVAGATGVIGRQLVPCLREAGHAVVAMTRSEESARELVAGGLEAVVCDALDAASVLGAVERARPEVVVHQLTALPRRIDPRRVDRDLAATNRLRIEGTRNLVAASQRAGVQKLVVQSIAFATRPEGPRVQDEQAPLYVDAPHAFRALVLAVRELEEQTLSATGLSGIALRYGFFYGPGTVYAEGGSFAEDVDRRRVPIVGDGGGVFSFVHVRCAAEATLRAIEHGEPGVYNIVDDEPAEVRDWLPELARLRGASAPLRVPRWLGRIGAGPYGVYLMTELRGASNAKAKRALGWAPRVASWRDGFRAER